jgi:hypothetical protein
MLVIIVQQRLLPLGLLLPLALGFIGRLARRLCNFNALKPTESTCEVGVLENRTHCVYPKIRLGRHHNHPFGLRVHVVAWVVGVEHTSKE